MNTAHLHSLKPVVVTAGEPAGIGPELVVQLAQQARTVPWVVVADKTLLMQRAAQLNLTLQCHDYHPGAPIALEAGQLSVLHIPLNTAAAPGVLNVENVPYLLACLKLASEACLDQTFAALVTGPVHKGVINQAGVAFSGHTEFFAEHAGVEHVVMMLVADTLRVALATTHIPLREVSAHLTKSLLEKTVRVLHQSLQTQFHFASPRIAVCGLNPHAGEQGHLGDEEIHTLIPVLAQLRAEGFALDGPLPADTAFTPQHLATSDAVLAMYHDQGLPVLKYAGFGRAVNVTLGLPYVRTSVDHGTALSLAGTGRANTGSFEAAIALAAKIVGGEHG